MTLSFSTSNVPDPDLLKRSEGIVEIYLLTFAPDRQGFNQLNRFIKWLVCPAECQKRPSGLPGLSNKML
jgi:hypothetical protein